jgi:hypothetical protein
MVIFQFQSSGNDAAKVKVGFQDTDKGSAYQRGKSRRALEIILGAPLA